jgi:hypothetical protein
MEGTAMHGKSIVSIVFGLLLLAGGATDAQYYQTDFPAEEFKGRHAKVFEQIGENAVAVVQGMPQTARVSPGESLKPEPEVPSARCPSRAGKRAEPLTTPDRIAPTSARDHASDPTSTRCKLDPKRLLVTDVLHLANVVDGRAIGIRTVAMDLGGPAT